MRWISSASGSSAPTSSALRPRAAKAPVIDATISPAPIQPNTRVMSFIVVSSRRIDRCCRLAYGGEPVARHCHAA